MQTNWLKIISISFLIYCCDQPEQPQTKRNASLSYKQVQEPLKKVNKYLAHKENQLIEAYIARYNYPMKQTGTGLRYYIYKTSKGKPVTGGKYVTVNYDIWLLNGKHCYSSKDKGPETFLVDQDDIESGLHEGIKLMKTGEKALFILPPHRAHGLIGDNNKIPPLTTVVYDIEVIDVKN